MEWQKINQYGDNAGWYTDEVLVCDICEEEADTIIQFKVSSDERSGGLRACINPQTNCVLVAIGSMFKRNESRKYILSRMLHYNGHVLSKSKIKREPIGLSKRYFILQRDGFQCVLCGASGKDAKLEIDHILPVCYGGTNKLENLRTLCFDCNRGKSSKMERYGQK